MRSFIERHFDELPEWASTDVDADGNITVVWLELDQGYVQLVEGIKVTHKHRSVEAQNVGRAAEAMGYDAGRAIGQTENDLFTGVSNVEDLYPSRQL
jgi:hypothetical protein